MKASVNKQSGIGYCSSAYANSLSHLGKVLPLQRSGGWCIQKAIPDAQRFDAIGPYPVLCCCNWAELEDDLVSLPPAIVSFACVIDPLIDVSEYELTRCFPDRLVPLKTHYAVDLSLPLESFVSNHHQRDSRRALRRIEAVRCLHALDYADVWTELYKNNVVQRHAVTGLAAFPPESLTAQLAVPGAVAFVARRNGEIIGMQLWYVGTGKAYYHLAAYSEVGYREGASYGLMWRALSYFQETDVSLVNLGGGVGVCVKKNDGLTRFKSGWSNVQRTAYLGGRVIDYVEYERLCRQVDEPGMDFFPGYRNSVTTVRGE